jgi:type II secretory pathway component PulF
MLTVFIFPKIMPIFSSLKVELPITTIILLNVSNFLRQHGIWVILGIIALIVLIIVLRRTSPKFRLFMEAVTLRIPLAGPMIKAYNVANFSRTLGLLLKSGATVTEAIDITGETMESKMYSNQAVTISEKVRRGELISDHLRGQRRLFPAMIGHMVAIGEKTGKLSETLIYLAGLYEEELDDRAKSLSSSIEPILMVVMGVMVGFVAVSVITPIYGITQSLTR